MLVKCGRCNKNCAAKKHMNITCNNCGYVSYSADQLIEKMFFWYINDGVSDKVGFGYGKNMLANIIEQNKNCMCPRCIDAVTGVSSGRVKCKNHYISNEYEQCSICKGRGFVVMSGFGKKINPASIKSTTPKNYSQVDDIAETIYLIYKKLTNREKWVLISEYLGSNTQQKSAKIMGISLRTFCNELISSKKFIFEKYYAKTTNS